MTELVRQTHEAAGGDLVKYVWGVDIDAPAGALGESPSIPAGFVLSEESVHLVGAIAFTELTEFFSATLPDDLQPAFPVTLTGWAYLGGFPLVVCPISLEVDRTLSCNPPRAQEAENFFAWAADDVLFLSGSYPRG